MMYVAGRRRWDFADPSCLRTHAQSRAEIESPRARGPYMAGCEFSHGTVLRFSLSGNASTPLTPTCGAKDDPAKARKGCSTAIGRAVVSLTGMLTVVRRGFPCGSGSTGQSALPNRPTTAPPSVSQSIYPAGSAGCMAHGRAMHGRQRELNLGVMGTIATCCAGFAHEPMFRAGRRMETA